MSSDSHNFLPCPKGKVRLAFVISSLEFGGAERDLSKQANFWAAEETEVCIFVFTTAQKPPAYPLDPRVQVYFLKDHFRHIPVVKLGDVLRRLFCTIALRRALKKFKPNVIVSYVDIVNITTLIVSKGLGIPVIVSERIDPAYHRLGFFHPLWDFIRLHTHRWASHVIVQTQDALRYFPKHFQERLMVIPNSVAKPSCAVIINPTIQHIVTIGRLCFQKDQETLLQAFSLIQKNHPTLQLTIYGEGPYRAHLEHMIHEKGLQNHVFLPGMVANVQEVLLQVDLFVFPSRYEGFPNALCEAMAVGLPIIASNCSGNTTVVQDGVDGLLFPIGDVQTLTQKMEFLIENFDERQRLSQNARYLPERFSENLNHRLWKKAITRAIRSASSEKC
ncbi:MAG: glycosyltransferase family 4 protein [Holosporales bacterium]|nr:glycosyltransferase family 4 protein [Holosporales bacterium]